MQHMPQIDNIVNVKLQLLVLHQCIIHWSGPRTRFLRELTTFPQQSIWQQTDSIQNPIPRLACHSVPWHMKSTCRALPPRLTSRMQTDIMLHCTAPHYNTQHLVK